MKHYKIYYHPVELPIMGNCTDSKIFSIIVIVFATFCKKYLSFQRILEPKWALLDREKQII